MLHISNISVIVLLLAITFQDFKQRQISWFLIPLLFIALVIKSLSIINLKELAQYTAINFSFIAIQLLLLTLYMSIKNKKFTNIIDSYLGLGDILFFVTICACFSPINFIVFYLVSIIFTLIGFVFYRAIYKSKETEIPLAGSMSFLLVVVIILNYVFDKWSFYNDNFLIDYFI